MMERCEVMSGLQVESSHPNQFLSLPVEVNTETFVGIVGGNVKSEFFSDT
jgi:hypothetical protein